MNAQIKVMGCVLTWAVLVSVVTCQNLTAIDRVLDSVASRLALRVTVSGAGPPAGGARSLAAIFGRRNVDVPRQQDLDRIASFTTGASAALSRAGLATTGASISAFDSRIQTRVRCPDPPVCDPTAKYRTADGTCNNINNPNWGAALTAQTRLLPPAYDDGFETPRTRGKNGQPLPSPREISNRIHKHPGTPNPGETITQLFVHWGQYLDHDVISTPTREGPDGNINIDCCNPITFLEPCFPIIIPPGDPVFKDCMNLVRSALAPPNRCGYGPRQQINQRTAFLDSSTLYGDSDNKTEDLRDLTTRGKMKVWPTQNFPFFLLPIQPPNTPPNDLECDLNYPNPTPCFFAGDHRSAETPVLTPLHVVWLREHNRIAGIFAERTNWDSDKIFQVTRKIVNGMFQHMTYNEFLPVLLSDFHMTAYGLTVRRFGFDTVYFDGINPGTINSFGAAAYRMGHSLVRNVIRHANLNFATIRNFRTRDTFFKTFSTFTNLRGADRYTRWMTVGLKQGHDRFLVDDIRDSLFQKIVNGTREAFDLASLNIQRGRDHGLPGYNAFRMHCGLMKAFHFGTGALGLVDHEPEVASILEDVYEHPDDIDLFPGGLSEKPVPGGLFGRTFSCILATQFQRYKFGDRFWYENNFPITGFTLAQLNSIKRQTVAKLLCRNMQFNRVQRRAFRIVSGSNFRRSCNFFNSRDLNFDLWLND